MLIIDNAYTYNYFDNYLIHLLNLSINHLETNLPLIILAILLGLCTFNLFPVYY